MEVPRAHVARAWYRAPRPGRAAGRPAPRRGARRALVREHSRGRAAGLDHDVPSSPTSWCSPASPPRSAGHPCTTGCPMRTPRRPHPYRPCSPLRSCHPCCLSPGASSRRSRPRSAYAPLAHVFVFFGLVSLAVAVPFLWRPLAWKRLLAYSSLEHMGVIALGIGFGDQLALDRRRRARRGSRSREVGRLLCSRCRSSASSRRPHRTPPAASRVPTHASALSSEDPSAALAGLPPSPLFISEFFIALGGIRPGHTGRVAVAVSLLALGFLGLAHALIDAARRPPARHPPRPCRPGADRRRAHRRGVVLLLALTAARSRCPADIARALAGVLHEPRAAAAPLSRRRGRRPRRGARLASFYASGEDGEPVVRRCCRADGTLEWSAWPSSTAASRVSSTSRPAAEWAEREAHDLHGVHFDGHEPLRALVDHSRELAAGRCRSTALMPTRSRSGRSMRA